MFNKFLLPLILGFYCFLTPINAVMPVKEVLLVHEALIPKFTDPNPLLVIFKTPPAPLSDPIPQQPYQDATWIPGYWAWLDSKNDFIWICGVWRRPPLNHQWISGGWHRLHEGWIWARGFWSQLPIEKLTYFKEAPPATLTENKPVSLGENYFWAPGYWAYSEKAKTYQWLSGKWEAANPDWVLAPAAYFWRPEGYVFADYYWDRPLEERGKAYLCKNPQEPLTILEPALIIQSLFFCYPDYLTFYWHFWHFHPHWEWEHCNCVPPWWHWHDWWFCSSSDSWGLWWWWSHPGTFPPYWLSHELSLEISPPPPAILEFFKYLPKPPFQLKLGDKALLPKGIEGKKEVSFPKISQDNPLGDSAKLPSLPDTQVTIPSPPPNKPSYPQETYSPKAPIDYDIPVPQMEYHRPQFEYYPPVEYYPPAHHPRRPRRPYPRPWPRPHQDHDRDDDQGKGEGKGRYPTIRDTNNASSGKQNGGWENPQETNPRPIQKTFPIPESRPNYNQNSQNLRRNTQKIPQSNTQKIPQNTYNGPK